jgi:sterigmatocystin biosynthesis cytochrome P450 monooxygenase
LRAQLGFYALLLELHIERSKFVGVSSDFASPVSYGFEINIVQESQAHRLQSSAPHHPIFGSLAALQETMTKLPPDVNPQYMPIAIRRRFPYVGNVFCFDGWPFLAPVLVTGSPSTAKQITQEHSLPKFPTVRTFFRPISGKYDLVTMEGPLWKKWRGVFSQGFGSAYLTTLMPEIIEEGLTFCEVLKEKAASSTIFQLKPLTDNFTVDVIGKIVL